MVLIEPDDLPPILYTGDFRYEENVYEIDETIPAYKRLFKVIFF